MKKKIWIGLGVLVLLGVLGGAGFVMPKVAAFNESVAIVYDVAPPEITVSMKPEVLARGKHLAESIGNCIECHGREMGGKDGQDMGPIGRVHAPNLTMGKGGVGADYTDGELARAVRDGLRADGTTLLYMPSQDFRWWPREDLEALVSYIRSRPPIDYEPPPNRVGMLGKVLDRTDALALDMARRIDHASDSPLVESLNPTPTVGYGANLALLCKGCHGHGLSGGKIPGTPSSIPIPTNLTPHETGLKDWSYERYLTLLNEGKKADGSDLDPFMPFTTLRAMTDIEKQALWAYLQALEPTEFGNR